LVEVQEGNDRAEYVSSLVQIAPETPYLNNRLRMECRTQKEPTHLRSTSEAGMDCLWPR
jgi:hypothetical protein